jgi:flavin-dependent dehydrogenase
MRFAEDYDAIVAGARPAGAATALLLARAGARVLVVERDAAGTDTLSTHALMRGAVMQLGKWGLLDRLAGTPPVRRTSFFYGDEEVALDIRPQHGVDALMAPRRTVLDPMLAGAAAEAGAEVRYRAALDDVLRDGRGRVSGAVIRTAEGSVPVAARLVVGADGRRSKLARLVTAPVTTAGRHAAASVYAYVAGLEDRGYRWHYGRGASAGAIPTNGGLHVVFAGVPPGRFRAAARGDRGAFLARVLSEVHRGLAAEVRGALFATEPVAFAGEPGFLRQAAGPGWALVGDAGYFKDPFTAHGITDALRDAEILARAVLAGTDAALRRYVATRDALSRPLFEATDALAALDWSFPEAKALHKALSAAMKAEQDWLAAGGPSLRRAA